MKYYFVGIKGTGMSSLAGYLQDKGAEVIGSDNSKYYFTSLFYFRSNLNNKPNSYSFCF